MEENKKRKLNLKIKTFSDFKRFTSKTLHKIVEKMRGKNELTINQIAKNRIAANEGRPLAEDRRGNISIEELTNRDNMIALIKHAARKSLIDRADRMDAKQVQKIEGKYNEKREILENLLEQGKITKTQYHKAIENLEYKTTKKIYEKDLSDDVTEKPKNPTIQRAIRTAGKVVRTVGKGISIGAGAVASVVALPFVMAYKGAKVVGRGVKAIGRGAQTAYLTAGKVAGNVKEQVQTANGEVNREMYEKASEEKQQEMMERAYKQADKENAKRDREAARRKNLHMEPEQQQIDHEEAMNKTEENSNQQELEEEK